MVYSNPKSKRRKWMERKRKWERIKKKQSLLSSTLIQHFSLTELCSLFQINTTILCSQTSSHNSQDSSIRVVNNKLDFISILDLSKECNVIVTYVTVTGHMIIWHKEGYKMF